MFYKTVIIKLVIIKVIYFKCFCEVIVSFIILTNHKYKKKKEYNIK